ncbi:MAG: GAF domain-containing sensor histidine kinase [Anaerolineae bacterium]
MALSAETLVRLTENQELPSFLEACLRTVCQNVGGTAGSLFFRGTPPIRIRHGTLHPVAADQVERWEKGVEARLDRAGWKPAAPLRLALARHPLGPGLPTLLSAPLLGAGTLMGSITLQVQDESALPTEQEVQLREFLWFLGEWAALLWRLRLTEQRLTQMELFLQIGQSMVSTFDLNQLLDNTTEVATTIVNASAASLMLIDTDTNELVFEHAIGEKSKEVRKIRIGLNEGIAGWVATHGQPVIANDAQSDPRFLNRVDKESGFVTRSIAAVPLEIRGHTIGVLEVLNKLEASGFDAEDLTMLHSIAAQAAIAIDNARLYQSLREERDKIIKAQEDVRRELARNLHDGTVQLLAAIAMGLDHVERLLELKPDAVYAELEALRRLVRQATKETRLLLFELRPVILETQGLVAALQSYVDQLRSSEAFEVHLEVVNFRERLPFQVEGTVFSIIQEAVNNIKRHASAQNVWLRLEVKEQELTVSVRDDGVGFDVTKVEKEYDQRGSFGLLNMKERTALLDGVLAVESSTEGPDRGTEVLLRVPLRYHTTLPLRQKRREREEPSHQTP